MQESKSIVPRQTSAITATSARLDIGAQVGVQRNAEFSAGGRTRKFSRNAYVGYRPVLEGEDQQWASKQ